MIQTTLFDGFKYPDYPGSRRTDTSREAANDIAPRTQILRDKVLAALKQRAMSADECAAAIGESILATRPRVAELNKKELVRDTGRRVVNASGKKAVVWRAV